MKSYPVKSMNLGTLIPTMNGNSWPITEPRHGDSTMARPSGLQQTYHSRIKALIAIPMPD